jgi:chitinase
MLLLISFILPTSVTKAAPVLGSKLLVGYWHNFDNGTGIIKLRDVSTKWDVLNVSFGETGGDRATVQFTPCYGTDTDFKSDVAYLKSIGKKVVLSIGGQNGVVLLPDSTAKQNFINSLITLIDKYGFDGIDIDLESGISLNGGDSDFKNPTTPQLVNIISAVRTLSDHYGTNFLLSMAPEIAYVQGGYTAYANIWGAYLPIIYGLRDKLAYIHVQHYNAGSAAGMDGVNYAQGTADFEVAMADMLLHGFPLAGNTNNIFPALREDQVMIGLPACASAAPSGGYISPSEMKKALDYLTKGISFGGKYTLSKSTGYPSFRGLMTWSINWDAKSNYEFSTNYRAYFDSTVPPVNSLKAATLSSSAVANGSFTLSAVVPAYNTATSYKFFEGTTQIASGTLTAGQSSSVILTTQVTNKQPGSYNYTVQLTAGTSNVTSNQVTVTVPSAPTLQAAVLSAGAATNGSYTLTAVVPANNTATSYKFLEGTTQIATGTLTFGNTSAVTLTNQITNKPAGSYTYTVVVYDASSNSLTSNAVTVTVVNQGYQTWAAWVSYKVGDIVTYGGLNYKCLQAHTSLPGWEPPATPALWQPI